MTDLMLHYVSRDAKLALYKKTSYLSKNVNMNALRALNISIIIVLSVVLFSWIMTEVRYIQQGDRHDWIKPQEEKCDPCMSVAPPPKMRKGMIAVEQADGSIKTMIVEITEEEY